MFVVILLNSCYSPQPHPFLPIPYGNVPHLKNTILFFFGESYGYEGSDIAVKYVSYVNFFCNDRVLARVLLFLFTLFKSKF